MSQFLKFSFAAFLAIGMFVVAVSISEAQESPRIFRVDTGAPGGVAHVPAVVLGKIWNRELGISVQINDGQTLTRSALKLGRGQLEFMPFPTIIYFFLEGGRAMYKKKLHKQAIEASKNVRSMWGWPASFVHPITFQGSGVKTYHDLKGKRVFTGPPSGAAAVNAEAVIRAVTGYKPNKDYRAIRLPWGGGMQAMLDGKLDVFVRGSSIGSAVIEQLGIRKKFRILDIGDAVTNAAFKKYLSRPGRTHGVIPAGTYKGQINGDKDIVAAATLFQMAVRKSLSDDLVYKLVKLTWDNLDEIHQTAYGLRSIKKEKPFVGVNMPLHLGAVKYYREVGVKIPPRLIPPEAK
jgi:TRAP transporter TAXI family solute receptor